MEAKSLSTTLPEDAHVEAPAVPSVEAPAPGTPGTVAEDSVGSGESERVVPVDRFNGLMSKFNQTQSALEQASSRIAELEARLNSSEPKQEETPAVSDDSALAARVEQLQNMLLEERLESAREKALRDYPEAAPFGDLIVADTPADVREMARLIAERAKAATTAATPAAEAGETEASSSEGEGAPAAAEAPAAEAPTPEAPVAGGGAAFSSETTADDRISSAIKSRNFGDFINAKLEKQAVTGSGNLNLG